MSKKVTALSKQTEKLAKEMLDEVKNIKDFAKEELPVVAKEYVSYRTVSSGIMLILSIIGLGVSGCLLTGGLASESDFDPRTLIGGIGVLVCFIATCVNGDLYLEVKLQPRRTAIKAITSLF